VSVACVTFPTVSVALGTDVARRPVDTEQLPDVPVTHDAEPPVLHVALTVAFATGPLLFAMVIVTLAFQPALPFAVDEPVMALTCIVVSPGLLCVVAAAVFEYPDDTFRVAFTAFTRYVYVVDAESPASL
jgi:hypothetical protein